MAALDDGPIVPVFVLDDETPDLGEGRDYSVGSAQRWWLHHSLDALGKDLRGHLVLRRGKAADVIDKVAKESGATSIHATRLYEPWEVKAQDALGDRLTLHEGDCLIPSGDITTGSGTPYKIFGPFWSTLVERLPPAKPCARPDRISYGDLPDSEKLEDWALLPTNPDWAAKFSDDWTPGEHGGRARLDDFANQVGDYADLRDLPSEDGTSRLSPHLHWGEVSARQVYERLHSSAQARKYIKELAWRDFARQAMLASPDFGWANGRKVMDRFPWRTGAPADRDFASWTRGLTGYPIVDAGMRQLWATGWIHNRVRMLVASFLTKHLLIDWRRGERWFWDTLVDADYGNNSLNWQWIAGTGTASQQFNRIMAPLSQSEKFDAAAYIRAWVPELTQIDGDRIHDPPDDVRGLYPAKIVGHREARDRALAALAKVGAG